MRDKFHKNQSMPEFSQPEHVWLEQQILKIPNNKSVYAWTMRKSTVDWNEPVSHAWTKIKVVKNAA